MDICAGEGKVLPFGPRLSQLFPAVQAKPERSKVIVRAHLHCGYSQQEIAAKVNLHDQLHGNPQQPMRQA